MRSIPSLVVEDIEERDRIGMERYGVPLTVGVGVEPLKNAYEEALDQAVYLRQMIEERKDEGKASAIRCLLSLRADLDRMLEAAGRSWPAAEDGIIRSIWKVDERLALLGHDING